MCLLQISALSQADFQHDSATPTRLWHVRYNRNLGIESCIPYWWLITYIFRVTEGWRVITTSTHQTCLHTVQILTLSGGPNS